MKNIGLVALALIFTIGLSAQKNAFVPVTKNAPYIKFEKVEHDYGTLIKGSNGDCNFEFLNAGDQPLVLTSVVSSCGCTIPDWPKEPIMPGKKAVIKVTYDTNRLGVILKQITVRSNAENADVVLTIKGQVNPS